MKIEYVEFMPEILEQNTLYISKPYKVCIHLCACSCGIQTVTPLDDETGWILTEEENRISLFPSIGNFCFPCKSHYFIKDNEVIWC